MSIAWRTCALFVALLLAVLAAMPLSAMRCETERACPMMAKRSAPCHPSSGGAAHGMVAPMICCETRATAAPASASAVAAPALLTLPMASAPALDAQGEPAAESWRNNRHALGLFTLHAVWRI